MCVVVDVQDNTEVVGTLKVTVEALKAFRSIMEDPDHDHSELQSERLQIAKKQKYTA